MDYNDSMGKKKTLLVLLFNLCYFTITEDPIVLICYTNSQPESQNGKISERYYQSSHPEKEDDFLRRVDGY